MTVKEMILTVIAIVTIVVSNFFSLNLKMPSSTILFIKFYRCLLWFKSKLVQIQAEQPGKMDIEDGASRLAPRTS